MQSSDSTGNVSFIPVHFSYKFLRSMYTVMAFVPWRPQWITRHAGHTEYSSSDTRPSYRKTHPIFGHSSVAQKPGLQCCITMLEEAYGEFIPSRCQPGRSSVSYNLEGDIWPQGDAYPRIPVDSPLIVICREIIFRSRIVCVYLLLAPDTSQTSNQERNGKGYESTVLVE